MGQIIKKLDDIRVAHAALIEAEARALARGLGPADIEREADDEDSQSWEDVVEVATRLKAKNGAH